LDRIAALQALLTRNPNDTRAHFGLAAEFEKNSNWPQVIHHLQLYLQNTQDQGNAWGRLARAYQATGNLEAATRAYRSGIQAAYAHGHPSMAAEFEAALEELP
jgi:predicted Zn-dependent protease